jgi:indole-3-glycerol phosphate synthase
MTTVRLDEIVAGAASRVELLRNQARELEQRVAAVPVPGPFNLKRSDGTVGVIAEIKRRSPSAGTIHRDLDASRVALAYAEGGAVAISVLTEETHFGGSLEDLNVVSRLVTLPVLRKDFILDELQLLQARAYGAAAALLIVRILEPVQLTALVQAAQCLGLGTLVEVHSEAELDTALTAGATVVGINSRDLGDFRVDLGVVERLLPAVPPGVTAVAESGIESREDVERLAAVGADAVLVGTAVARSPDPRSAVAGLVGVRRRGRSDP